MHRPQPITSAPTEAEFAERLRRVRARMAEKSLAAYVVSDPDNVYYLTNFANYVHERPFVIAIPENGPMRFVVPQLEGAHVRVRSLADLELVHYFEFPAPAGETWSDRLREQLPASGRIGVESRCPLQVYEEIPGTRVRADLVDEVRERKSPYEIGRISHASEIISQGHEELLQACQPGVFAMSLFGEVTRSMTGRMLRDMPHANMLASHFAAVVQPPSISHDPHNFTDTFIQLEHGGPHVSVVNCRVNGYGAEIERTFFLGSVPDAARQPFDVMLEARRIARERTLPGESMSAVDQAVRDHFEKHGYLENLLHRTGHSFGVTGHEAPFLAVGHDRTIEPGMLFSIEPGIYLPGIGGFRHSDTILVSDEGNHCLTEAPESLEELTLPV